MVSRYHWVTLQSSGFFSSGSIQTIMFADATIPAHAILKKILFNKNQITARQQGGTEKGVNVWQVLQSVRVSSGPNNNHILWEAYRKVPMAVCVDTSPSPEVRNAYYFGGDDDFGVNEQCSIGKSTDAANWTVHVDVSLVGLNDGSNVNFSIGAGSYSCQVKFLYYL